MSAAPGKMELLIKRSISVLDVESLEYREAKEALFRNGNRFILYLSDGLPPPRCNERLIPLSSRDALLWLNENQVEAGSFWE